MLYDFDETGLHPDNRITNEVHTLAVINSPSKNFIVPKNAPFFAESMVVTDTTSGVTLIRGIDYEITHKFKEAFDTMNRNIYGSITILDVARVGPFTLTYQTLGGDFVTTATQAIANGFDLLSNLTNVLWENIASVPAVFPPVHHDHVINDIDGVKEFLDEMQAIRSALENPYHLLHLDDVQDLGVKFIDPLLLKFDDLSAAFRSRLYTNSLYFEQNSINGSLGEISLGAKSSGVWFDLPLEVTVQQVGTYKVGWSKPEAFADTVNVGGLIPPFKTHLRFVVDDGVVTESYANGAMLALAPTMVIKMQARVSANVANFLVAPEFESFTLTATRVSN